MQRRRYLPAGEDPLKRDEGWIEAVRCAHPDDAALFGTVGAVTAEMCTHVSSEFVGKRFAFMDETEFKKIGDACRMNQIYWREILYRVYWVSALNLMRHKRWQDGCVSAFRRPANFLSFAANLRGLVEASSDAEYSLKPVPLTLAKNRTTIESALQGKLQQFSCCEVLEDRLIHFVYARKLGKNERPTTPESHAALEPKDYQKKIRSLESDLKGLKDLYNELCGICHPTMFSLRFLYTEDAATARIVGGQDDLEIRRLCQKQERAIELVMTNATVSAICLKALNLFSLPETRLSSLEHWSFEDNPLWRNLEAALLKPATK